MAVKAARTNPVRRRKRNKYYQFTVKSRHIRLLLDRVLFFRYLRLVQGRFWGVTAMSGMIAGFSICFFIRPDMLDISTAFSDFGNDVRTAPYFAGSVFFAAYGLWRWRLYLSNSWKRAMPVTGLITLTIIGLYLVALMPISWEPVYNIHIFGFALAGVSMLATVVLDGVLTHTREAGNVSAWRTLRYVSFIAIVLGGWLTFESSAIREHYNVDLLGESLMLAGYFLWIIIKTYQGQGRRTLLSKFLKDFVLVD